MNPAPKNIALHLARKAKKDEFYTQLSDIENELRHYKEHFKGKVVLCNCDDPEYSNFHRYFRLNFVHLGLKKLITTHYKNERNARSYAEILTSEMLQKDARFIQITPRDKDASSLSLNHKNDFVKNPKKTLLKSNGDFRSPECERYLKECDVVVTNPPFSLFREFIALIFKYKKRFLLICNKNSIILKDVFSRLRNNELWVGVTPMGRDLLFDIPKCSVLDFLENKKEKSAFVFVNNVIKGRSPAIWLTNLEHKKRHKILETIHSYHKNPQKYPKYDNYDAINVDKVSDIPLDYDGIMGVPITFLDKHNPEQFEILGKMSSSKITDHNFGSPIINGKIIYSRIIIRNISLQRTP